jgi:hypothetical protein
LENWPRQVTLSEIPAATGHDVFDDVVQSNLLVDAASAALGGNEDITVALRVVVEMDFYFAVAGDIPFKHFVSEVFFGVLNHFPIAKWSLQEVAKACASDGRTLLVGRSFAQIKQDFQI